MSLKTLPLPVVFNFEQQEYLESILFIGFLPLVILLVLMIALMIYYCVVKFSSEPTASKPKCCSLNICCYTNSGKISQTRDKFEIIFRFLIFDFIIFL